MGTYIYYISSSQIKKKILKEDIIKDQVFFCNNVLTKLANLSADVLQLIKMKQWEPTSTFSSKIYSRINNKQSASVAKSTINFQQIQKLLIFNVKIIIKIKTKTF